MVLEMQADRGARLSLPCQVLHTETSFSSNLQSISNNKVNNQSSMDSITKELHVNQPLKGCKLAASPDPGGWVETKERHWRNLDPQSVSEI